MKRFPNSRILHGDGTPPSGEGTPPAGQLDAAGVQKLINNGIAAFAKNELPRLFDPFSTQLTGLGDLLKQMNERTPSTPPSTPLNKQDGNTLPPETNQLIQGLKKEVETLRASQTQETEKRIAAEKKALDTDQESKVRAALKGFDFATEDAAEDAYTLVSKMITRSEDGNLVSSDNLPYDSFIKDFIPTKKPHLLAPVNRSGAGATAGTGRQTGRTSVDIADIKPGASKETLAAAGSQIRALIAEANGSTR
jgi:hypothetical protein